MRLPDRHETAPIPAFPSPLTAPPERTRDWSADDLEVDISDPQLDLTFDDSNRLEEDAQPVSD